MPELLIPSERPFVSVVIPVLNEERHIRDSLESVFAQDYPSESVEILVADGGSEDRTREIVTELCRSHSNLRLIENPGRNQAAGLNRAIAVCRGEIMARLDGHAAWRPWHLRRCVELLAATGADNVGGRMEAVGETPVAAAVAVATSSPLGMGGARFHYSEVQRDTDTVFLGCFRRSALERVGPFNELYPPHEDYELNYRIRSTGGRVLFSPDIPTTYWARTTWKSLARQYFRYGRAKMRVARVSPGVVRPYHLVPPAAVAVLVGTLPAVIGGRGRTAATSVMASYATLCIAGGLTVGRRSPWPVRVRVPLVMLTLHMAWGSGFWAGLLENAKPGGR